MLVVILADLLMAGWLRAVPLENWGRLCLLVQLVCICPCHLIAPAKGMVTLTCLFEQEW